MKRATKKVVINLPQILFELRFQRRAIYTTSHGIRIGERNLASLIPYILQSPTELVLTRRSTTHATAKLSSCRLCRAKTPWNNYPIPVKAARARGDPLI
jgi:hypothetical protein